MANSIADKMRIKPGMTIHVIDEPKGYAKSLGKLPAGVKFADSGNGASQMHWFVETRAEMEKALAISKWLRAKQRCGFFIRKEYPEFKRISHAIKVGRNYWHMI